MNLGTADIVNMLLQFSSYMIKIRRKAKVVRVLQVAFKAIIAIVCIALFQI